LDAGSISALPNALTIAAAFAVSAIIEDVIQHFYSLAERGKK
jgi:hypothetical protein